MEGDRRRRGDVFDVLELRALLEERHDFCPLFKASRQCVSMYGLRRASVDVLCGMADALLWTQRLVSNFFVVSTKK